VCNGFEIDANFTGNKPDDWLDDDFCMNPFDATAFR